MRPGTFDMKAAVGVTYTKTLTLYSVDADGEKTLINLTGYTARMQVRTAPETTGDPLIDLTESNGLTLGGAMGTIVILISATVMDDIPPGNYAYDLLLTHSGIVDKFLEGKFRVEHTVTRSA